MNRIAFRLAVLIAFLVTAAGCGKTENFGFDEWCHKTETNLRDSDLPGVFVEDCLADRGAMHKLYQQQRSPRHAAAHLIEVYKREWSEIVVAANDIPRGAKITREMVTFHPFKQENVPEGAVKLLANSVEWTALVASTKGEPLLLREIGRAQMWSSCQRVPPGMRIAVVDISARQGRQPTHGIKELATVASTIPLGSDVAVLLTGNVPDAAICTLIPRAEVVAVSQAADSEGDGARDGDPTWRVCLLVTPQEATLAYLGKEHGTLSIERVSDVERIPERDRYYANPSFD